MFAVYVFFVVLFGDLSQIHFYYVCDRMSNTYHGNIINFRYTSNKNVDTNHRWSIYWFWNVNVYVCLFYSCIMFRFFIAFIHSFEIFMVFQHVYEFFVITRAFRRTSRAISSVGHGQSSMLMDLRILFSYTFYI